MRLLFALLLLIVLIAGCSGHSGYDDGGRIAAVVNGAEITRREVDFIYRRSVVPGSDDAVARNRRRNILAGLVRAELLSQQAEKRGLDKSPEFLLAMHDARRRVLAGLEEEKIVSSASEQVSPEVVRNVISSNPNLFAGRKLLVFEEVLFPEVDVALLESLNASAGKGVSLAQLLDAAKARGKVFLRSVKTMTSDQLQPAILKVLSVSRPNVPVVIRVQDKFSMILILRSMTAVPVEGDAATVAATRLVQAQQRNMELSKTMNEVLDASKITYFGEFKADSASLKRGEAPMPTADPSRVAGMQLYRFRLAVSLGIAFMGAMLMLVISKTILAGKVWKFPLGLPFKKNDVPVEFNYDVFEVPPGVKLVLFIVSALVLAAIGLQLYLAWNELAFWMLSVAVVTGLAAGIGGGRLFALAAIEPWIIRLCWLFVLGFAAMSVVALLVTMRIIFI